MQLDIEKIIMVAHISKALGVDGFNVAFFRECWVFIKEHVLKAIMDFFDNSHLLKHVNITSLTLIHKVLNRSCFVEFRPILVCQMVCRYIAKALANRIKCVLLEIIDGNQHAFSQGRSIH